jgi:hypothetical protein
MPLSSRSSSRASSRSSISKYETTTTPNWLGIPIAIATGVLIYFGVTSSYGKGISGKML